jgi:predicted negative regulator of RcsB-dependent stress response
MPFYYQASVTLFDSIISGKDGNFERSDTIINEFLSSEHYEANTRSDNALRGRLHISSIENKIHRYDKDVAATIYSWEGIHPLSTFEIEVTRRLQGVAAKFFHSIGDFKTTRASLEQHLWLNSTMPIRHNTKLLIVTRLAEIHCELHEYDKALLIIQAELDNMSVKKGRPFRRLTMAMGEAYIGLGQYDDAKSVLEALVKVEPPELDDLNDQVLRMRRLILSARIQHQFEDHMGALMLWNQAGQQMQDLSTFHSRHGWIAAIIQLSIAHARISLGDDEGARGAWDAAVEVAMRERFEFVFPVLATTWLQKIVGEIYQAKGWPLRIMMPGGKSDLTWL